MDIENKAYNEALLLYNDTNRAKLFSSICKQINDSDCLSDLTKFLQTHVLTSLTLKDNEFRNSEPVEEMEGYKVNIRYDYIVKSPLNKILNLNAYNLFIRAKYSHNDKKQLEFTPKKYNHQLRIYISKGGVITGECIKNCIIKDDIVKKGEFNIPTVPMIPVCMVINNNESYYVVDHREPKIKSLNELYEVPIYMDEKVAKLHMNLRKYVKLNKSK